MATDTTIKTIISLVIAIMILMGLGTLMVKNTDTRTCGTVISAAYNLSVCPLENASTSSKSMYSIVEFLYPIMGVLIMVGVGLAYKKKG